MRERVVRWGKPGLWLAIMTAGALCLAGQRGVPVQHGLLNFGQVNTNLYRGAAPGAAGVHELRRLGVKTIIDLRTAWEARGNEAATSAAEGVVYTNIPMDGLRRPTSEQVKFALALISSLPGPVYVHCEHGCDRTGTIIACYRLQHDGWTLADATAEAATYGMSPLEVGMKKFIDDFAAPVKR